VKERASRSAACARRCTRWSAADAGADAIGLVFYRESPRFVTPGTAAYVVAVLPPFVTTVGLFVDADEGKVRDTLQASARSPAVPRRRDARVSAPRSAFPTCAPCAWKRGPIC
jgi:hypothetical protein